MDSYTFSIYTLQVIALASISIYCITGTFKNRRVSKYLAKEDKNILTKALVSSVLKEEQSLSGAIDKNDRTIIDEKNKTNGQFKKSNTKPIGSAKNKANK